MGRKARNYHWDSGKRSQNHDGAMTRKIAVCGEDFFNAYYATERRNVDCPKCAAILAQLDIDAWNADPAKPKLALERIIDPAAYTKGSYSGYRWAYKAMFGGEQVGWILVEGAFGSTRWYISGLGIEKDDKSAKIGFFIDKHAIAEVEGKTVKSYRYDDKGHAFTTKEDALLAVPGLIGIKKLKDLATTLSDRDAWQARIASNEAAREAEEAQEADRLARALAGLREIRGINSLSDEAREGLEFAIAKLGGQS